MQIDFSHFILSRSISLTSATPASFLGMYILFGLSCAYGLFSLRLEMVGRAVARWLNAIYLPVPVWEKRDPFTTTCLYI